MATSRVSKIFVDRDGYIFIDGIKIGRRLQIEGVECIQFCDKDPKRSQLRGSRFFSIGLLEFVNALEACICEKVGIDKN